MTGIARLRAKICPLNFTDKNEDFMKDCIITNEEMLVEDTAEKSDNHIGSESEPTNTTLCKLPPNGSSRDS